MQTNSLIQNYKNSNLLVDSIFKIKIKANSFCNNTKTSEGVCGFVIPIKGRATYKIDGKEYILKPGTILHAGPLMKLEKKVHNKDWNYILLHYKILNKDENKKILESTVYTVKFNEARQKGLMELVTKLLNLEKVYSKLVDLHKKINLYQLIFYILQVKKENEINNEKDKMLYISNYINLHVDEIKSVSELSEKIHMTEKEFYYNFKKKFDLSPKQYITSIKIKKAKELIVETELSIGEISYQLGYDDPLYFSRMFKKHIGKSPSEFRKNWKKSI